MKFQLTIDKVRAQREAVDKLIWDAILTMDVGSEGDVQPMFLGFSGEITLRTLAFTAAGRLHPTQDALRLPVRWHDMSLCRRKRGRSNEKMMFLAIETELPGDALERIESMRGEDVLSAELYVCFSHLRIANGQLFAKHALAIDDVSSQRFEFSDARWEKQILAVLRPEGMHPRTGPSGTLGRRSTTSSTVTAADGTCTVDIAAELTQARSAFESQDYAACIRTCNQTADNLYKQMSSRTGLTSPALDALKTQARALSAMPADGATRALAHHVLISTASLFRLENPYRSVPRRCAAAVASCRIIQTAP